MPSSNHSRHSSTSTTSSNLEALLEESSDPALAAIRTARLKELASSVPTVPSNSPGHGTLVSPTEKEAIQLTASSATSLLLFTHKDMATCATMQKHLETLSQKHPETCCVVVQAEECEWLCGKMGVRVLPVLVGFVAGREVGRLLGFEGVVGGSGAGSRGVGRVVGGWGVWSSEGDEEGSEDGDGLEEDDGLRGGLGKESNRWRGKGKTIRDGMARGKGGEDDDDSDWD